MERIILDAEAGQVSAELVRRGIAADARVHVLVEVRDAEELSTAADRPGRWRVRPACRRTGALLRR